ncbi:hypothetical protein K439DRAFT_1612106 [Ramaria rubella]|nr:hypothetical protein K439DRAFT_1612106 [Ramaria rubella]
MRFSYLHPDLVCRAIFDIVLIVVTLYHTLGLRRLQVGSRSDKKSLTSMLMQQGLVRFLFSLTVTVTLIVPNQVLAVGVPLAFVNRASNILIIVPVRVQQYTLVSWSDYSKRPIEPFLPRPPVAELPSQWYDIHQGGATVAISITLGPELNVSGCSALSMDV